MKTAKHNKIIEQLQNIPSERVFLTLHDRQYTFGNILALCQNLKKTHPTLINKNCAIISDDRESIAIYLPAIDSICNSVFFVPNDIEPQQKELCRAANVDTIITLGKRQILSVEKVSHPEIISLEKTASSRYILSTSGTTGQPKLAEYSLASLTATTKKNTIRGAEFTWALTYDINRFAGLQVYLQALMSGSTLVFPPEHAAIDSLIKIYTENSVNCISATPSFWRKLLMQPAHKNIPLTQITLGGEISNQSILSALSSSYNKAKVSHIYASTEAGVGFAVSDNKEGFPLSYLHTPASSKFQLKITDNTLWIKTNRGCSKIIKGTLAIDEYGYVNTGDRVKIQGSRVIFLGRDSGSINVGGNKVMPEKVESVLEDSPLVSIARVVGKQNAILGSLVSAELVLTDLGKSLTQKELKTELVTFCRLKLEPFEIPALFKALEDITTNTSGKKLRKMQ